MTRQAFTPRAYQHQIIDHVLEHPRCAIWAGMGMGKTSATLSALDALELVEQGPALVIAPLRVAVSTWPDEAKKWTHLSHLEIVPIVGTVTERRSALARASSIYTTNYEQLPWLVEELNGRWPFKTIVADESTRLKGFRLRQGTSRARALAKVAHTHATRFIELTGTPSPNGLQDLWGQSWFLDAGKRLGRSFDAFINRWFQSVRIGGDPHAVQVRAMPHAQAEIEERLRDLCLGLDARDWFDLKAPVVNIVRVDLPPKARALYREMEREMFAQIGNVRIEAFDAAARTNKCLQLANGAAYVDDRGAWVEVHDAKLQALESIIEEACGAPVLVAYHFRSDLERLRRAFPKGRALDNDPQTLKDWNQGKVSLLFAHPASAGHGLNLQDGGNILVFFGHWWDLEQFQQMVERIGPARQAQAGHDRAVFIHHLVSADTVDEIVMKRRDSKRAVQDLLLEAMNRQPAPAPSSARNTGRCTPALL